MDKDNNIIVNFDSNDDLLQDFFNSDDSGTQTIESEEYGKEWNKKFFVGYMGLNILTIYKEDINVIRILSILNPDKKRLNFLIKTLKEHQNYINSKLMNNKIDDTNILTTVEKIVENVIEKIDVLDSIKYLQHPNFYYINIDSNNTFIEVLNNETYTRDLINYFYNELELTDDVLDKLDYIINSANIILKTKLIDNDKFINQLGEYKTRNYEYSDDEIKALEFIEAPTSIINNESILKPRLNTDINYLVRNSNRYLYKKSLIEVINVYNTRINNKKPNLNNILELI